jgi:biopolymer transport protein ExbD
MKFQRSERVEPSINLTPLIDILFIVLIFLVLTTTFEQATMFQVNLPQATTGERQAREAPGLISIGIGADGSIEIGGARVSLSQLSRQLAGIVEPERASVRLRADALASHGIVVRVMDTVRQAGIFRLDIETRMPTEDPR